MQLFIFNLNAVVLSLHSGQYMYNLQNNARTKFTSSIVLISTLTNVILITDQTMIRNTKFKNLEFRFSVTFECFHFH